MKPIYKPDDAAKVLWWLILTERALLEHFDTPPKGHEGPPERYRNLAREYMGMRDDPDVLRRVENYWQVTGTKPGDGLYPNDYSRPNTTTNDLPF